MARSVAILVCLISAVPDSRLCRIHLPPLPPLTTYNVQSVLISEMRCILPARFVQRIILFRLIVNSTNILPSWLI